MYWRPELADAHYRYWVLIRAELSKAGVDSPADLTTGGDDANAWLHPDLVLSQTCGMPYRTELHGKVSLVGTPDYGIEGCAPGFGRSVFVTRSTDPRSALVDFASAVFAYNATHSESGFASPYRSVTRAGFWFERFVPTGQHLESARAVAEQRADIASIDAVTWRLVQAFEPFASDLRVIGQTDPVPWLPYITRLDGPVDELFTAVENAIDHLESDDRSALGITAVLRIPVADYLALDNPPADTPS